MGSDLKTPNPATGEAEKGCLYYPQPPPGHGLYPSRKTYGKQKLIELEKLHHCTFVSGDFQNGGDITFVLNMLVTQREVQNFRSMIRDVNVAQGDPFPLANKRDELVISKRMKRQCEECEGPLDTPIQYCSCCGAARCSSCISTLHRIPGLVSLSMSLFFFSLRFLTCTVFRHGYEDFSWRILREHARPADPSLVTKVLEKSTGIMNSAVDRASSTGSLFASNILSYAVAVSDRVKSLLPVGAAAAQTEESEEHKAANLSASRTAEAGAGMLRKSDAELRAKEAEEQRAKIAKEMEGKDADEASKNPALKAIPALKPQVNPKQLPNEVQKRPNDPSARQPCRLYPWLFLWKEYSDRVVSGDGGDKIVHVRRPFSSAEAQLKKRDPSLPIMESYLDKEIGWITHVERANFEDALFSQPVGRCCAGKMQQERDALQDLIQRTQMELRTRANSFSMFLHQMSSFMKSQNDGSVTQRTTASDASAMAAAAADEAAEQVDDEDDDDQMLAMLPSYTTSESGNIIWTYMDQMAGNVDKLKPVRKHGRPDDAKSYLPAR